MCTLPFPESLRRHTRWGVVRHHGNVPQADRESLRRIIDEDFDGTLDGVVDDASHMYDHSLASFETRFPRLRPGGMYLIEDWSWAHHPSFQGPDAQWADEPALSNLIMRLVILSASAGRRGALPRMGARAGLELLTRPAGADSQYRPGGV